MFRAFTPELECIAKTVEAYLAQNLTDRKIFQPFTSAVVATYVDNMKFHAHCDQVFDNDGKFVDSKNTQVEDTATVVLVIGESRDLIFTTHRIINGIKEDVGIKHKIKMNHGDIFILDPDDEQPMKRNIFENEVEGNDLSFYKHGCDGIGGKVGMSIGIVFRTTKYLAEVRRDTGQVILDENLDIPLFTIDGKKVKETKPLDSDALTEQMHHYTERNEMLISYMEGNLHPLNEKCKFEDQRVDMDQPNIKTSWDACKEKFFPIIRVAGGKRRHVM